MPTVRKRPAATKRAAAKKRPASPDVAQWEIMSPLPPRWVESVAGATAPQWAEAVTTEMKEHYEKLPQKLTLNLWSDCCGLVAEAKAGEQISDAFQQILGKEVAFNLYFASDCKPDVKNYVMANCPPKHWSDDMTMRNTSTGKYWCARCEKEEDHATSPSKGTCQAKATKSNSAMRGSGKRVAASFFAELCMCPFPGDVIVCPAMAWTSMAVAAPARHGRRKADNWAFKTSGQGCSSRPSIQSNICNLVSTGWRTCSTSWACRRPRKVPGPLRRPMSPMRSTISG